MTNINTRGLVVVEMTADGHCESPVRSLSLSIRSWMVCRCKLVMDVHHAGNVLKEIRGKAVSVVCK